MDILAYKFGWDTFTGWIEAFLCRSEQAKKVIKIFFFLVHKYVRALFALLIQFKVLLCLNIQE